MKFGKHIAAGIVSAVAATFAVSGPAAAQSVIKIGSPTIKESVHFWMLDFEKRIEARSAKKYDVKVFPLSQLGSIPRMVEGAQLGTNELVMVPFSFLVGIDQRFQVMDAPGIFKDQAHGYRTVQDPEFKKAFWHIGESKGIEIVGLFCPADTNYASRTPIRKLDDFKGKKIRVFASAMEREGLNRVGATAAPMPLSEVLPALQRGVLDAAKSGMTIFVAFKFQHTAKYVTRTNEALICIPTIASKNWLDKLPADDQKMIREEAAATDAAMQPDSEKFNANIYNVWKKMGGELIDLSPAEKAEYLKRLSTVGDAVLKDKPEVAEMYELMKKVAARHAGS